MKRTITKSFPKLLVRVTHSNPQNQQYTYASLKFSNVNFYGYSHQHSIQNSISNLKFQLKILYLRNQLLEDLFGMM